jgi:hypothetical protein
MRGNGSLVRGAAALMAPAVALAVTLGAGPAQAAARAPQAGVTWHKLTGINGWHARSASTGSPAYAVSGGVVYLSGAVTSTGTNPLFAVLPSVARPSHTLYVTVYTHAGAPGTIKIVPNGDIRAVADPSAFRYTSLAGVSFPARSMSVQPIPLIDGWASSQAQFKSGDPGYSVSDGVVYLSGSLHQVTGTANEFAKLPAALRPASDVFGVVFTMSTTHGTVWLERNGVISAYRGQHRKFTSLAGLSYPLTAGHRLALMNGWRSAIESSPATYRVSHGVVHLTGSIHLTAGSASLFAVLPAGVRPKHFLYITVVTRAYTVGTVKISPTGAMYAFSRVPSHARNFTSLAGISFPLGS